MTLLITRTGIGFGEEHKKAEIKNSKTLNEAVKNNVSKREKITAVFLIVLSGVCIGATMWHGKDRAVVALSLFGGFLYFCTLVSDWYKTLLS